MFEYLMVFILGGFPIAEIRGAIIYGMAMNLNMYYVFAIGALGNIIAVPIIFFALEKLKFIHLAKKLFGNKTYIKIEKHQKAIDKWGELALLIFTAIPAPMTGAWTASLIAVLLKMNKKKSFVVITLGILIAGTVTWAVATGIITGLSSII
ncbi:small multi-drug export protein [Candidatus Woesearchaeota archaeon]|jgi:uncharacterized membrane protein|nr:small multi-drug export protein [Candidatus Woesearchaeota archaeon]MBT7062378.1 small multi-drug export protein [Candidatus Woesearchaeota archaeon]MBT7402183.1 small multi-drug export protein [Candidatus Woesearchaeota archaeon]